MWLLLGSSLAFAQQTPAPSLNAQTLQLSTSGAHLTLHDPRPLNEQFSSWRTTLSYTNRPLDYVDYYGTQTVLVGSVTQLQIGGAHEWGRLRLGVDLPVLIHSGGISGGTAAGLGSARLDGQYALWEGDRPSALYAGLHLPTGGNAGASLNAQWATSAGIVTQRNIGTALSATGQVGTVLTPTAEVEGAVWGPRLRAGLGLAWRPDDQKPVLAEWIVEPQLKSLAQLGSELLLATEFGLGDDSAYTVSPAFVAGLTDVPGTPRFRAMIQARREVPYTPDLDHDGLLGAADLCPDIAEDADGWEDTDGCPEDTLVTLLVIDSDGFEWSGLNWRVGETEAALGTAQALASGIAQIHVGDIVQEKEIPTGAPVTLTLTVPAPRGSLVVNAEAADGTAITDARWSATGPIELEGQTAGTTVPVRPGSYTLRATAAGFRPAAGQVEVTLDGEATLQLQMLPARATMKADRIEIKDSVYFETGSATIKQVSLELLSEIAEIIAAHPEIKRLRIEGHTDSRGARSANQALSQRRAEAVRTYLIEKGVASERLTAVGYGEDKPLDRRETGVAWEKNRRVDFFIEEMSKDSATP